MWACLSPSNDPQFKQILVAVWDRRSQSGQKTVIDRTRCVSDCGQSSALWFIIPVPNLSLKRFFDLQEGRQQVSNSLIQQAWLGSTGEEMVNPKVLGSEGFP